MAMLSCCVAWGCSGTERTQTDPPSTSRDGGAAETLRDAGPAPRDAGVQNFPPEECPTVPADPSPDDGVRETGPAAALRWTGDRNFDGPYDPSLTTYDLYFGPEDPPALAVSDLTEATCTGPDPTSMTCTGELSLPQEVLVYWRVVAKAPTGCATSSPVWDFAARASNRRDDNPPCPGTETVTDWQGNIYDTVEINGTCWMASNLKVGTPTSQIPFCNGEAECPGDPKCVAGQCTGPLDFVDVQAWCPDLDPMRCEGRCGAGYRWWEIMQDATTPGFQGICPTGWHIPTRSDWDSLATTYGNDAPGLTSFWGRSGFDALLCGRRRDSTSQWELEPQAAFFWSSTDDEAGERPTNLAYARTINKDGTTPAAEFRETLLDKNFALAVRCVKDP